MKRILDKIPTPPGALPARAQSWLLLGLTAVIVIALLTFPGQADGPQETDSGQAAAPAAPGAGSPVGVSSVESAAQRMREAAAREAERRLRTELGAPEPRPDGLPPSPAPAADDPYRAQAGGYAQAPSAEEQIALEERLRRYRSLRAPALVQSHRAVPARASAGTSESPPMSVPFAIGEEHAAAPGNPEPAFAGNAPEPPSEPSAVPARDGLHVLREGEFLEAVLTNRLSGDFAGPVNAMLSADVYDRSRQRLLIPRGSRALGAASRVEDWEQVRLAVVFHRLILPDGRSIDLAESTGLNQIGERGLKDLVNRRYASTIAAAGAVGALAGLTQAVSPQDAFVSRLGSARLASGAGLSQSAMRMLDRYLNRLPKVAVREGHRIRIYLTADLKVPAYRAGRSTPPLRPGARAAAAYQGDTP